MCHYEAPFLCCTIVTFNSRASRSPDPEPSNHSQMKVQMKSQPTLHTKDPIWKKTRRSCNVMHLLHADQFPMLYAKLQSAANLKTLAPDFMYQPHELKQLLQ